MIDNGWKLSTALAKNVHGECVIKFLNISGLAIGQNRFKVDSKNIFLVFITGFEQIHADWNDFLDMWKWAQDWQIFIFERLTDFYISGQDFLFLLYFIISPKF